MEKHGNRFGGFFQGGALDLFAERIHNRRHQLPEASPSRASSRPPEAIQASAYESIPSPETEILASDIAVPALTTRVRLARAPFPRRAD